MKRSAALILTVLSVLFLLTPAKAQVMNPMTPGNPRITAAIVTAGPPSYREILVDPNAARGAYPTIAAAFTYTAAHADSTHQWTVRLLPGTYTVTAVLTAPSYTSLVGAGKKATIINRTTAVSNLTDCNSTDPVINATGTTAFHIRDLSIINLGNSTASVKASSLCLKNATDFSAHNVYMESGGQTVTNRGGTPTSDPPTYSQWDRFYDSEIVMTADANVTGGIDAVNGFAAMEFNNTTIVTNTTKNLSTDTLIMAGGYLVVHGGEIKGLVSVANTNVVDVLTMTQTGGTYLLYGTRILLDYRPTGGDLTVATTDSSAVAIRPTTVQTADGSIYLYGCKVEYASGTLTAGRAFSGIRNGAISNAGNLGNIYLVGTDVRDLGGSGASNRSPIIVNIAKPVSTTQQPNGVFVDGSDVPSWSYNILSGAPTATHTNMVIRPQSANYQSGTCTFASAATCTVTLGIAYPNNNSFADYRVALEPSANETFWVTGKAYNQFVINSSNATSTAVVQWSLRR